MIENGEKNQLNNSIIKADGIEMPSVFPFVPPKNKKNSSLRNSNGFLTFEVRVTIPYQDAASSNFYGVFYTATAPCFLLEAKERHTVAASDADLAVAKVPSGTAKSAAQSMLESYFDLAATANTIQSKVATISLAGAYLAVGDSLVLKPKGTLTSCEEVTVTVLLGIQLKDLPVSANV